MFSLKSDQTESMDVIEKLLNLNSAVEENIFKKTKFLDEELEKTFLIEENNLDERFKIKSDIMIILGWSSIFIYIYIVFYKPLYIITCSIFTFISIILSCWRYINKSRITKLIIDHVQVFLLMIYLNLKALYIIFFLSTQKNDNDQEIIRTIIYNWVATTFLTIQKLDGRPWVYLFFTAINFSTIIIIHIYSYNNYYYYLDGISSVIIAIGGYIFKKYSDIKLRNYYGEKMKNKKISNYFLEFINGLNGFYLSFKNDETISYGSKMKKEMESLCLNTNHENLDKNVINNNLKRKESDKFIFLNSKFPSGLPEKFLKSLVHYDKNILQIEDNQFSLSYNQHNDSLLNKINKLQNADIDSSLNFKNIGIYLIRSKIGYRYYDVYYRKVNLTEKNIIYDLVFYKATDLIVSLIKIEEETQHKKQILGKLVHEFKTPLNSILGLIDNIKEKESKDKIFYKHDLNIIKNLSNYVIFLINDIIHYSSRKNYKQLNIIMNDTNIRKVVIFSFEILNSLLSCNISKSQSIRTELEFQEDLYNFSVNADETRLKQILLNLISNAVKFTNSGFIILKCYKHPEKELILVSVADSGSGIKDENQKNIFCDYFMDSEGYRNNSYGTGIGLSICKNLAERMGMDIKFTSRLGQGTEFIIEIPIKKNIDINIISNKTTKNEILGNNNLIIKQTENLEDKFSSNSLCQTLNSKYLQKSIYNEENDKSFVSVWEIFYSKQNSKEIIKDHYNHNNKLLKSMKSKFLELSIDKQKNNLYLPNNLGIENNIQNDLRRNEYENLIEVNNNNIVDIQFLIVDDDKYICNSIKILVNKIFKEVNCMVDVITASDGVHIIQKVIEDQSNGNKIKCIITDENMEFLNGSDAIKIMRSLEKEYKIKNIKIITATSQEDIQLINKIKSIGADLVMSKPLSKSTLTKALQDLKILN